MEWVGIEKEGVAGWLGMLKPETVLTGAWLVVPELVPLLVPPKKELGITAPGQRGGWLTRFGGEGEVVEPGWSDGRVGCADGAKRRRGARGKPWPVGRVGLRSLINQVTFQVFSYPTMG